MLFDELEPEYDDAPALAAQEGLFPPREMESCMGQEEIEKELLALTQSNRMAHALIFSGQEGIGKATMAFRLTRFLLTQKDEEEEGGLFGEALPSTKPDDFHLSLNDPIFRQIASGGHPDLLTVERAMDERAGKLKSGVSVDSVRKVAPFLRMTASQGGWRIVIVDDADTMNRNAQNALLKILEEPPEKVLIILITHRIGAMIPTIRSRCRIVPFPPLGKADFTTLLRKEHPDLPLKDIDTLHSISTGSGGQALTLLEEGGLEAVEKVLNVLQSWPRWHWPEIHKLSDSLARKGQENSYAAFCNVMLWINDSLLRAKARNEALPENLKSLAALHEHYSLKEWIKISENLKAHFETFDRANLDKRQAVLGMFAIFS